MSVLHDRDDSSKSVDILSSTNEVPGPKNPWTLNQVSTFINCGVHDKGKRDQD